MIVDILPVVNEPFHTALETGQLIDEVGFQDTDGKQGDQSDHRTYFERQFHSVIAMEYIAVETILFIPEFDAICPHIIHCMSDIDEMLEELAGNIAICAIFLSQFESNREHVQTVHGHPAGTIGLFQVTAIG